MNKFLCFIETFIPLLIIWYIMSGILEPKFIAFALISCAIITLASLKVLTLGGLKTDREYYLMHINWIKFGVYIVWLIKEIVKASWDVSKVVMFKRDTLNPHIVWFKADYDHPSARALLANSITLTPGTITVDIFDDGVYSIHALTDGAAEGVLDGSMQQRIAKLFGETIDYKVIEVTEDMSLKNREAAKIISKRYWYDGHHRKLERRG